MPPARYAGRHAYTSLLRSGVRVFEYHGRILHDKYIVVDGVLSVFGSHNFDLFSERHNLELGVAVPGEPLAARLEHEFDQDLAHCKEIRLEDWIRRGYRERALEWCSLRLARL